MCRTYVHTSCVIEFRMYFLKPTTLELSRVTCVSRPISTCVFRSHFSAGAEDGPLRASVSHSSVRDEEARAQESPPTLQERNQARLEKPTDIGK